MDRIKIEYIYLAAIIAAFVAVLVIGFFLRRKFRKYQPVQDGLEFEVLCTQILTAKGYENVELTPTTGDYGVDIFAEKDGVRWAFQCKYYTNPVGVRAVQEIYSGRDFYHCMVGVVMTNSRFTKNAVTLANELNILLWDGKYCAVHNQALEDHSWNRQLHSSHLVTVRSGLRETECQLPCCRHAYKIHRIRRLD